MSNNAFDTAQMLNDIDDSLVSEAADAGKTGRRRRTWLIPAAAAAVVIAGAALIVSKVLKTPDDDKTAYTVPTESGKITAAPLEPTDEPTPDPAFNTPSPMVDTTAEPPIPTEPDGSDIPKRTAEPHPTEATHAPDITEPPVQTPQATPKTTPKATTAPEPTRPPETESRVFNSVDSFVSAVRSGSDSFLNGIDCWYSLGHGLSLNRIEVTEDEVFYYYALEDGSELLLEWFRSEEASARYFEQFTSLEGEWHDNIYLVCSQAGVYFGYAMDAGHLIRMMGAGIRTAEQAAEYYSPVRHEI